MRKIWIPNCEIRGEKIMRKSTPEKLNDLKEPSVKTSINEVFTPIFGGSHVFFKAQEFKMASLEMKEIQVRFPTLGERRHAWMEEEKKSCCVIL